MDSKLAITMIIALWHLHQVFCPRSLRHCNVLYHFYMIYINVDLGDKSIKAEHVRNNCLHLANVLQHVQ